MSQYGCNHYQPFADPHSKPFLLYPYPTKKVWAIDTLQVASVYFKCSSVAITTGHQQDRPPAPDEIPCLHIGLHCSVAGLSLQRQASATYTLRSRSALLGTHTGPWNDEKTARLPSAESSCCCVPVEKLESGVHLFPGTVSLPGQPELASRTPKSPPPL